MPKNKEVIGLRFEIAGLLMVLFATVWQGAFTDWFDRTNQNWIAYTQEGVNSATLLALRDLSQQIIADEPERRRALALAVYDTTNKAYFESIRERENRSELQKGQASFFGGVRYTLLLLGAALVVLGKWLVLQHKSGAANAGAGNATAATGDAPKDERTRDQLS